MHDRLLWSEEEGKSFLDTYILLWYTKIDQKENKRKRGENKLFSFFELAFLVKSPFSSRFHLQKRAK